MMIAGLWNEETGESIKIASDGTVLDGQQRLQAIIKSGMSLAFLIVEDLNKEVFSVLDSGIKRTPGDTFHCAGISNSTNLAAGIKRYLILKGGRIVDDNISQRGFSTKELLTIYYQRKQYWNAAANMSQVWYDRCGGILSKAPLLGFYSYFYDIDEDDAFTFMEKFANGVNLSSNNPIKLLRDKLFMAKINTRFSMSGYVFTALIIKAWNYYRKGEEIKLLKFTPNTDTLPIAI